jgi:hypothetical protein
MKGMRVRSYDAKETLDAETRADDLNAHRITRLSLDMGIANNAMVRRADFAFIGY